MSRLLAARLAQGRELAQAIAADGLYYPDLSRSDQAGLKRVGCPSRFAGAWAAWRAATPRPAGRSAWRSFYPLLVLMLATACFWFVLAIAPFLAAFEGFHLVRNVAVRWLASAGNYVAYWGRIVPALVSCCSAGLYSGRLDRCSRAGRAVRGRDPLDAQGCSIRPRRQFADLLALLISTKCPYADQRGCALAAQGVGAIPRRQVGPAELAAGPGEARGVAGGCPA